MILRRTRSIVKLQPHVKIVFDDSEQSEDAAYALLIQHVPFRNEAELQGGIDANGTPLLSPIESLNLRMTDFPPHIQEIIAHVRQVEGVIDNVNLNAQPDQQNDANIQSSRHRSEEGDEGIQLADLMASGASRISLRSPSNDFDVTPATSSIGTVCSREFNSLSNFFHDSLRRIQQERISRQNNAQHPVSIGEGNGQGTAPPQATSTNNIDALVEGEVGFGSNFVPFLDGTSPDEVELKEKILTFKTHQLQAFEHVVSCFADPGTPQLRMILSGLGK